MDRTELLFVSVLFLVLAGLTSLASSKVGVPDTDGAIAAAVERQLTDAIGADTLHAYPGPLVLCVASTAPLNMAAMVRDLAETAIRPVPLEECTSETIEGDFGIFSALTTYYGPTGGEAAYLKVVSASCSTSSTCVVDIDTFGSGYRYRARRNGRVWTVVDKKRRWVV